MIEIKTYTAETIPEHLHWQILDFLRMEWPDGFQGNNRLRDWITPQDVHPINFVLVDGRMLISHMEVVWKYLEHNGITYKTYGLTGVLTYPQFRKQGYGIQVLSAATEYIRQSDADIAMYHVGKDLVYFYQKAGWKPIYSAQTLRGDPKSPTLGDDVMMALFLTEKGKQGRKDYETMPFYFGEDTW